MLWVFELVLDWIGIRSSPATTTTMNVNSLINGKAQEEVLDELIEQNWFFENLFNRAREKNIMFRCYSYPSCLGDVGESSLVVTEPNKGLMSAQSLQANPGRGGVKEKKGRELTRQASLQATTNQVKIKERVNQAKKADARRSVSIGKSLRHGLLRTPLPPNIGRTNEIEEEEEDDESDFRMSNLIQQALPCRNSMKFMRQSGANEMRNRFLMNQKKTRKSLIKLKIEEVCGFKELGFNFDREDLAQSVVNLVPNLQEKKKEHLLQNNNVRRPYLSAAWLVKSPAPPPVPNCFPKKSADDVKKQIKFWARAVASHVRQEC